jgi:hypothetical protein
LIAGVARVDPRARALLESDSALLDVVTEAVRELRQAFENARIDVDYFEDHDEQNPVPQVTITVLPHWPPWRAHEMLERFDERWLFDNMHRADGRFGIDVHPLG